MHGDIGLLLNSYTLHMFEYSLSIFSHRFLQPIQEVSVLIKMFCQKSEAAFGRNNHKRRRRCQKVVFFFKAQRSDFINKDFKFRCTKPVCRPTSFSVFRYS